MRWKLWLILTVQAALVVLLAVAVRTGLMPLGIRGEWEWMRLADGARPPWDWLALAAAGVAAYAAFVGLGLRGPRGARHRDGPRRAGWPRSSSPSIAVQVAIPIGAPDEYDLTKWAYVNYLPGSTGYFKIARDQAAQDPWQFLARYPDWIRDQDSLHIGTHPPGLIVAQCILLRTMERNPALAGFLTAITCRRRSRSGFGSSRAIDRRPIRRSERAALYATALLTLLACAGTVVPLYLLARAAMPAPAAWAAAALWPLVPAANLFQPVADTTYPLLSTSAWALAAWAVRWQHGRDRPALAGLLAGRGLGARDGLRHGLHARVPAGRADRRADRRAPTARQPADAGRADPGDGRRLPGLRAGRLARSPGPIRSSSGAGTCTTTRGSTTSILAPIRSGSGSTRSSWRSRSACRRSSGVVVGLLAPRTVPASVWATLFVLVLVNLTGRNMGEVARLWMLFTPPFLHRRRPGPRAARRRIRCPGRHDGAGRLPDPGAPVDDPGGLSGVRKVSRGSRTPILFPRKGIP